MSSSLRKSPVRDLHAQGISNLAIHIQFASDTLLPSLMLHIFLSKLHSDAAMVSLSKANNHNQMLALSCEKVNLDMPMLSSSGFMVHINIGPGSLLPLPTLSSLYSEMEITNTYVCASPNAVDRYDMSLPSLRACSRHWRYNTVLLFEIKFALDYVALFTK